MHPYKLIEQGIKHPTILTNNNLPRASPWSQMLWFFSVNYAINIGVQPAWRFCNSIHTPSSCRNLKSMHYRSPNSASPFEAFNEWLTKHSRMKIRLTDHWWWHASPNTKTGIDKFDNQSNLWVLTICNTDSHISNGCVNDSEYNVTLNCAQQFIFFC